MSDFTTLVSSDVPVEDPTLDGLGYAPFAKGLAASVQKMPSPHGYVMALNGAWGLGKSTVIKFLLHYLQEAPDETRPLIVEFSPWMYSGHEDLARRFCDQLFASLTSDQRWRTVASKIKRPISSLANAVSEAPHIGAYGKMVAKVLDNKADIHTLKQTVSDILAKEDQKIVVVIDDVDRLTPEEMLQLFRVVKAVANFPNVVYLIAFDKEVVAKALTTPAMSGAAYLEKIVQAGFDVPAPSKARLQKLFFQKLDVLMRAVPEELFDQQYWAKVYLDGIDHFLTTPRHVMRLINALATTFGMVQEEVNPIDFVALEALRLYSPALYQIVRANKQMFTGYVPIGYGRDYQEASRKAFHTAWLTQLPEGDKEPVQELMQLLFPKLKAVFGNTYYGDESYTEWRKQYRVCTDERFDIYFSFQLPDGILSRGETNAFLSLAASSEHLVEALAALLDEPTDRVLRLRTHIGLIEGHIRDAIPSEHIPHIISALLRIGDKLIVADEKQGMFDFGVETSISRIISQGLKRLPTEERFPVFKDALKAGEALAVIIEEVTYFGTDHDTHEYGRGRPVEEQFFAAAQVEELETLALEKIRQRAAQGTLLYLPNLTRMLYRWMQWSSQAEPQQWVAEVTQTDAQLMVFLEQVLGKTRSITAGERLERTHYVIDPQPLEPFMDPASFLERVKGLATNDTYPAMQRMAALAFIQGVTARQAGKDPHDAEVED